MSDPHWLDEYPPLGELVADEALAAQGVTWRGSAEDGLAGGQAVAENHADTMPMGTLWTESLWEANVARATDKIAVADGGLVATTGMGFELEPVWYTQAEPPHRLYLAASSDVPPLLWLEVDPTPEAMADALASLRPPPEEAERTSIRAIMGYQHELVVPNVYSGQLQEADPAALTNFWLFNPYRFPTLQGWVTYFTRSYAGYDLHPGQLYVWDMEYAPNAHTQVVERVNALTELDYPEDMPLDLLGVTCGFGFLTRARIEDLLEEFDAPEERADLSVMLGALIWDDPEALEALAEPLLEHEDERLRRAGAHLCYCYGVPGPMERAAGIEPIDELRELLEQGPHEDAPLVWQRPVG